LSVVGEEYSFSSNTRPNRVIHRRQESPCGWQLTHVPAEESVICVSSPCRRCSYQTMLLLLGHSIMSVKINLRNKAKKRKRKIHVARVSPRRLFLSQFQTDNFFIMRPYPAIFLGNLPKVMGRGVEYSTSCPRTFCCQENQWHCQSIACGGGNSVK
jgi:hypothetical protein